MKRFFLLVCCFFVSLMSFCQDVIITKDAKRIECTISEVSSTEVRYKLWDNQQGPTFVLQTTEISSIIFQNGSVQVFDTPQQAPEQTTNVGEELFGIGTLTGNNFNVTNMGLEKKREKKKRVYEKQQFALLHYGFQCTDFDSPFGHALGVSYGRVKLFGWYTSFMLKMGKMHYAYDGEIRAYEAFYTGNYSLNYLSFSAGGMVRIVIPLYFYAGLGYAYQSETRETTGGKWVMITDWDRSPGHTFMYEAGFQGNLKNGLTFSFGMTYTLIDNVQFKFGIGYTFKAK